MCTSWKNFSFWTFCEQRVSFAFACVALLKLNVTLYWYQNKSNGNLKKLILLTSVEKPLKSVHLIASIFVQIELQSSKHGQNDSNWCVIGNLKALGANYCSESDRSEENAAPSGSEQNTGAGVEAAVEAERSPKGRRRAKKKDIPISMKQPRKQKNPKSITELETIILRVNANTQLEVQLHLYFYLTFVADRCGTWLSRKADVRHEASEALQMSAEIHMNHLFQDCHRCTMPRGGPTLSASDMKWVLNTRKMCVDALGCVPFGVNRMHGTCSFLPSALFLTI